MDMKRLFYAFLLPVMAACSGSGAGAEGSAGEISVAVSDVTGISAAVEFVPSDEDALYYCSLMRQEDFVSDENVQERDMERLLEEAAKEGISSAEALRRNSVKGHRVIMPDTLRPGTEYVAYAYYVDAPSEDKDLFSAGFSTSDKADFTVDIEVLDVSSTSVSYRLVPSDNEMQYYYNMMTLQEYEQYGGDEGIAEYLVDLYGGLVEYTLDLGPVETRGDASADTDYVIFAFGFRGGAAATGVFRKDVRTPSYGDASDMTVTISPKAFDTSVSMTMIPSDKSHPYFFGAMPVKLYEEYGSNDAAVARYAEEIVDSLAGEYPQYTRNELVSMNVTRGDDTRTVNFISPLTDYVGFAFACKEDGSMISGVSLAEFTTCERVVSAETAEIWVQGFYNGSQLAERYPEYKSLITGRVVVKTEVERSEGVAEWICMVKDGTLTEDIYSYDRALYDLKKEGTRNESGTSYVLNWRSEYTFLSVSRDADGNYGPVFRVFGKYSILDAQPADDFPGF